MADKPIATGKTPMCPKCGSEHTAFVATQDFFECQVCATTFIHLPNILNCVEEMYWAIKNYVEDLPGAYLDIHETLEKVEGPDDRPL